MRQNLAELDLGAQLRLKYEAGLRLQHESKLREKCDKSQSNLWPGWEISYLWIKGGSQKTGIARPCKSERRKGQGRDTNCQSKQAQIKIKIKAFRKCQAGHPQTCQNHFENSPSLSSQLQKNETELLTASLFDIVP